MRTQSPVALPRPEFVGHRLWIIVAVHLLVAACGSGSDGDAGTHTDASDDGAGDDDAGDDGASDGDAGDDGASDGDAGDDGASDGGASNGDAGSTPAGPVYYFSDCQTGAAPACVAGNNTNEGTSEAAPRRDLTGINVNTLPSGTQLLFKRGGSWNWSTLRLARPENTFTPLTFDAYGTGAAPTLRVISSDPATRPNYGFEFSAWGSTAVHGGYAFRNLKLDGGGSGSHAFFLRGAVDGVEIENVEITQFQIAINAQGDGPIRHIKLRNSRIVRNLDMGMLGGYNDSLIEGNVFEGNNFSGSAFSHGTYLSGHGSGVHNLVLRNNQYLRNSVTPSGNCTGGNMTFHGVLDNVLIEGNTIEQDTAAPECWLVSITAGYDTAESFTHFIVRGNRLINGGNTAIAVQSAPGIVVEGNVIINTQATSQSAISLGNSDYRAASYPSGVYPNGDAADGNATVRDNTVCRSGGASGGVLTMFSAPGTTVSGNSEPSGTAASTGVCAR
jgi:hypothetical protein